MNKDQFFDNVKMVGRQGLGTPIFILVLLAMVMLPIPPSLLDLFFTFNISFSLIILLVVVHTLRPLDFAIFPTVILVSTLLRLALNVESTRVVLLEGHQGGDAAGKVIAAFGEFVIGGNYTVGFVVFAILVIINFVVVTKGAGRVSEVSARFTLDALPGKQMSIDADLNSGMLTQEEARLRREEIAQEADFYGSMDGASKFVRGDAIAGILILFINIIGGFIIGTAQHGLSFSEAAQNYALLTIGDGLVAQVPSLLLSTASAIIVTRVTRGNQDMGNQFFQQFTENPKVLAVTAGVIGMLGIIPGMPNLVFLFFAGVLGGIAYLLDHKKNRRDDLETEAVIPAPSPETNELSWDDVLPVDIIGLEVGYRFISLVDRNQGGQLMMRIKGVRKKLSQELGFLIPSVHIRDNLDLAPNDYRISILGVTVSQAEVYPERELAINPGQVFGKLKGIEGHDPAFGLEAVWIEPEQKDHAQTLGYTVVDPGTVIATHLSHILQTQAHQIFGHEDTQQLLDGLARKAPKLVEDLIPKTLPLSIVVKVLQNLLKEKVPIRDIRSIVETLAEYGAKSQDPDALTAVVRTTLGPSIVQKISGIKEEIPVITLKPDLEQLLHQTLQTSGLESAAIEPGLAQRIQESLRESTKNLEAQGHSPVLLVSSASRPWLARFVRHTLKGLHVLAYTEIPDERQVKVVATVGQSV